MNRPVYVMSARDEQYQNRITLARAVSRLLPYVFFQPVWIHFVRNLEKYSTDFIQNLLHDLLPEQTQGDLANNCQVMFMCAFLRSQLGDHAAALAILKQILKMSETHRIQQIARFAAWGACAMCVRMGDNQRAVHWLRWLQRKLKDEDEWVLSNILELYRQILEGQAQSPDSNEEFLDWLLRWGEWPLDEESTFQSVDGSRKRSAVFPLVGILSRLARQWGSFWHSIRHNTDNKPLLLRSPQISIISDSSSHLPQAQTAPSPVVPPPLPKQTSPLPDILHPLPKQKGIPSLAVYCLGPFRVYQDEQPVEDWPSSKGKAVFKYLITHRERPVIKDILMDLFWPDSPEESARNNLNVAVYGLRQALRKTNPSYSHVLFSDDCYSLNPGIHVWLDYEAFLQHIAEARKLEELEDLEAAMSEYSKAETLYQGEFLAEDRYEDWPVQKREQLKEEYLGLLDRLKFYYFEKQDYQVCITICRKMLVIDPCREEAHRHLMQCYFEGGQPYMALRQYHQCVDALKEELKVGPSAATKELYEHIHRRSQD
jgi:DNA-binding SARP family transcriptional activator